MTTAMTILTMTIPISRYTFEGPDLIVANVQTEDEGVYTCEVITNLDMAEASGSITLVGMEMSHFNVIFHTWYDAASASVLYYCAVML